MSTTLSTIPLSDYTTNAVIRVDGGMSRYF